jgi:hypothetical protein
MGTVLFLAYPCTTVYQLGLSQFFPFCFLQLCVLNLSRVIHRTAKFPCVFPQLYRRIAHLVDRYIFRVTETIVDAWWLQSDDKTHQYCTVVCCVGLLVFFLVVLAFFKSRRIVTQHVSVRVSR